MSLLFTLRFVFLAAFLATVAGLGFAARTRGVAGGARREGRA